MLNPAGPLIEEIELVIKGIDEGREPLANGHFRSRTRRRPRPSRALSVSPLGTEPQPWRGAALVHCIETLQLSSQRCCDQNPR